MSTTQLLRRPAAPRQAKLAAQHPPEPHLPQPAVSWPPADFAAQFETSGPPGYYNQTAKAALLRGNKQSPAELLLDFSQPQARLSLTAAGEPLICGPWTWQAIAGGKSLQPAGEWSEVCWHREKACDYLEMELPLSEGWNLARLAFLSRPDRVLVLADSLVGPEKAPVEIRYQQALPLGEEALFQPASETREGVLCAHARQRAGVVPLALTEWRSDFCHAEFGVRERNLELEMAALGRGLFAPLWIDLDSRRLRRPLTWRRLAVGENLQIVSRDIAAGYRIQAGREQWLLYNSLTPTGNRSVLGHNTAATFVFGRVKQNGDIDDLLSIES